MGLAANYTIFAIYCLLSKDSHPHAGVYQDQRSTCGLRVFYHQRLPEQRSENKECTTAQCSHGGISEHLQSPTRRQKVYLDGDRHTLGIGYHAVDFYLAGSITAPQSEAAYVISENTNFAGVKLTANPHINLFGANRAR